MRQKSLLIHTTTHGV